MSTPSINLNEAAKAGDTPPVIDPPAPPTSPAEQSGDVKPFTRAEKNPSEWDIQGTEEDGMIVATHTNTRRVFEGSIEEFNALLRG